MAGKGRREGGNGERGPGQSPLGGAAQAMEKRALTPGACAVAGNGAGRCGAVVLTSGLVLADELHQKLKADPEIFPGNKCVELEQRIVLCIQARISIREIKKAHLAHSRHPKSRASRCRDSNGYELVVRKF